MQNVNAQALKITSKKHFSLFPLMFNFMTWHLNFNMIWLFLYMDNFAIRE